jgi:hypothetical protein
MGDASIASAGGTKLVARLAVGDQLDAGLQECDVGFGRIREMIGNRRVFAHVARDETRVAIRRVVGAGFAQRVQRQIERELVDAIGQRVERNRRRKIVGLRGAIQGTIWKHQRQFTHAQHVAAKRVAVEADRTHAPVVRVHGLDRFEQARFVIGILTLKMLRPQKQTFYP